MLWFWAHDVSTVTETFFTFLSHQWNYISVRISKITLRTSIVQVCTFAGIPGKVCGWGSPVCKFEFLPERHYIAVGREQEGHRSCRHVSRGLVWYIVQSWGSCFWVSP
jgi:hypothetical protein